MGTRYRDLRAGTAKSVEKAISLKATISAKCDGLMGDYYVYFLGSLLKTFLISE